ncbi:hypothetical protein HIM_10611 [Hirsutella minnesotensis 3608]|uniref:YTH domain-containing protein n=1 Tax=Hirsutella minnesotensis 3608 TaxID=1043627 RepID=A0A0F7ZJV7_9HYPO|nr:hypothetical protein HIM_10611 [Hirsutella minnesotensis 3608]
MDPVTMQDPEVMADTAEAIHTVDITKVADDSIKAVSAISVPAHSNDSVDNVTGETTTQSNESLEDRLQGLLQDDIDLRLWLQHTGYFDPLHRERVLEGFRKLAAIDEERQKLIVDLQNSTNGIFHIPSAPSPPAFIPSTLAPTPGPVTLPYKPAPATPPSFASMTSYSGACSVKGDSSVRSENPGTTVKPHLPMAKIKSKSSARSRRMSASSSTGESSRYFLVKSYNSANVCMSQRDGLWVTQAKNSGVLMRAFKECKNVYLFFSINKSHCFQGYARITSAPDTTIPKPAWIEHITLSAVSQPFRIEWLNTSVTNFDDVGEVKNPWNEWRSVVVGRDGQEYPPEVGRKVMGILDGTDVQNKPDAPPAPLLRLTPRSKPDHDRDDSTELDDDIPSWRKKRAAHAAAVAAQKHTEQESESEDLIDCW